MASRSRRTPLPIPTSIRQFRPRRNFPGPGHQLAHQLHDREQSARAVHVGGSVQRGATGHEERDDIGDLPELARCASAVHDQCECAVARIWPAVLASPATARQQRQYLSVHLRRNLQSRTSSLRTVATRSGSKLSLFGFYALSFADSDLGSGGPLSVGGSGGGGFRRGLRRRRLSDAGVRFRLLQSFSRLGPALRSTCAVACFSAVRFRCRTRCG